MKLYKTTKGWLLLVLLFFAFSPYGFGQEKGIWTGAKTTFEKTNNADYTKAANQDRITDSIWITRKSSAGIFNIRKSTVYTKNTSPRGTKWAFGTTKNIGNLTFQDWENAVDGQPPGMVNQDMVMFIVDDSIYIDIQFTSWQDNAGGGGFKYTRSTDCRSFKEVKVGACDSFTSPSKKYVFRKSGTYMDTITNSSGCDSILTLKLTIYSQDTSKIFMSGCGSVTLPFSKRKVTQAGIYIDTLLNGTICGRDSFVVANVYIYPVPTRNMTVSSCDSFISPSKKYVWKTSGKYTDVLPAAGTCDTVVNIDLTIYKTVFTKIKETACDSFISVTNKIYRQTGNYFDTLQTTHGCDSIIDLDLTVNKKILTKKPATVCTISYTSPSGKYVWGSSGIYFDTLMRSTGCDSILEINLIVNPKTATGTVKSCDPWTMPSGKRVLTTSGTYIDTVATKDQCDSVVTINFTRTNHTTASVQVTEAINRYHSPSGNYVWGASGTYFDTIPNKAGCDSIISFDITVKQISTDVTVDSLQLTAVADGVDYQWLDCNDSHKPIPGETSKTFKATKKGHYAVEISNQWNADTSDCIAWTLGIDDRFLNSIKVYPNPNNGRFVVELGDMYSEVQSVQIFDAKGELVMEKEVQTETLQINMENQLASGIYLIRIVGNEFTHFKKVLIP